MADNPDVGFLDLSCSHSLIYIIIEKMKPSVIFNMLADKVSEVCEIPKDKILSASKSQPLVDARVLLVQYLRRVGFSSDDVARLFITCNPQWEGGYPDDSTIKQKAKGIDKMFCSYSTRCLQSYAFCLMSLEIKKFCRETYSELYCHGMKELPD